MVVAAGLVGGVAFYSHQRGDFWWLHKKTGVTVAETAWPLAAWAGGVGVGLLTVLSHGEPVAPGDPPRALDARWWTEETFTLAPPGQIHRALADVLPAAYRFVPGAMVCSACGRHSETAQAGDPCDRAPQCAGFYRPVPYKWMDEWSTWVHVLLNLGYGFGVTWRPDERVDIWLVGGFSGVVRERTGLPSSDLGRALIALLLDALEIDAHYRREPRPVDRIAPVLVARAARAARPARATRSRRRRRRRS